MSEQSEALVPIAVLDDEDPSPAKRARQDQVSERAIISAIETAVSTSVAAQLAPITGALQALQQGQAAHGEKLGILAGKQDSIAADLHDMRASHSKRMDALLAEIVQLQKAEASRPTSPTSPGAGSERFHAVPPPGDDASFDLIIGGWPEGRSRETLIVQLNKLVSECQLSEKVVTIELLGKCPAVGKLLVQFASDLSLQAKRQEQLRVRDVLREKIQSPMWCNIDKPPHMRQISKAVAMLSGFLTQRLAIGKKDLVVGNWEQAKAYLGESRIMRRMPDRSGSGALNSSEKMLLQDAKTGISIAVDLGQIASHSKRTEQDLAVLWNVHFP